MIQFNAKKFERPFNALNSSAGCFGDNCFLSLMRFSIDENAGSNERASEFAGLLRAQLSNHEQALLCLNSLSTIGAAWKEKKLIQDFHMIKNLPEDFFDPKTEFDVLTFYPDVAYEFKTHRASDREPNRDVA